MPAWIGCTVRRRRWRTSGHSSSSRQRRPSTPRSPIRNSRYMSTDQTASDDRPLVILHTAPQPVDRIFTSDALATLTGRFTVVDLERADDPGRRLDELLPQAFAI